MDFNAMANDALVPAISKDIGKKKRTNRSARLKQCKLDARREQWLSQVKNKGCKVSSTGTSRTSPPHPPLPRAGRSNLETRSREEEREGSGPHDSDLESPAHSPTSSVSQKSSRKHCPTNSISSGSSIGSCSRSVSDAEDEEVEEGEEDKGGLDDWEAVADALTANIDQQCPTSDPIVSPIEPREDRGGDTVKLEPNRTIPRAWRLDDAFRPQSLPNLSKQRSFPVNIERHCGTTGWAQHGILSQPSSCPICYEDLDLTDSSFLPCSCGFRLCLFCHKKILEADGRCPGCRKQYGPTVGGDIGIDGGGMPPLPFRLSRSCSMSSRS